MNRPLFSLAAAACLVSVPALMAQETGGDAEPAVKKAPARPDIYDASADAGAQIADALARARKENRRVLIQWGANWCGWCHLLHDHFRTEKDVQRKLLYEYDVVLVDVGRFDRNLELAERYGAGFKDAGVPFITILDADGKVLANQETGSLELQAGDKPGHDAEKVLALLTAHQAPYRPAQSILSDALKQAGAEDKTVFLHFGAPWCGWCHRLEDWLARPEVQKILAKDFVEVKVDTDRTIGGKDMLARMTKGVSAGIPWFAFLDADGVVIADSFIQPGQNLGHPYTDEEVAAFAGMLETVTERISLEEREDLMASLKSTNAKKK